MRQKALASLILLIFLISVEVVAGGLRLDFIAKSTGNDKDNSMSTYSYIKEPRIEETGHTRGLKSGSFNYFKDGSKIDFYETLMLDYGNATNISNSSLSHTLNLTFEGGLGISEMYGSGLYPNNRGLAAWKKIRYETSNYLKTKDGEKIRDFKANKFWVNSAANMYTRDDESVYSFDYQASAEDAVLETRDYAGWSNRTGSRRIDVEHSTMMTGDFDVTNIFQETMFPGPDVLGDWLPCCFNSTIPSLRQPENPWPSQVIISTLKEYPFQPKIACKGGFKEECGDWQQNETTKEWEKTCKLNPSAIGQSTTEGFKEECGEWEQNKITKEWEKTCKLNPSAIEGQICKDGYKDCPESGCPGFECIKTFNDDQYDYAPEVEVFGKKINAIQAIYSYGKLPENDSILLYPVSVRNIGINTLNDVTLKGILTGDFKPICIYVNSSNGPINLTQEIEWDATRTSFIYNIGDLTRSAGRKIYLLAAITGNADPDEAKFSASGNTTEDLIVKDEASWLPIDPIELGYAHKAIKLPDLWENVNPIMLDKGQVQVNNTSWIFDLSITNENKSSLLEDVNLVLNLSALATTPELAYEVVDGRFNRLIKPLNEKILELELQNVDPSKTNEIQIVISENITEKFSDINASVKGSLNKKSYEQDGGGEIPSKDIKYKDQLSDAEKAMSR